ncbi:MAG: hypothetical protein NZO58_05300 [Gemmataceae bacterium]|nr:hypothetical protein [Gemmataceae bacterium]
MPKPADSRPSRSLMLIMALLPALALSVRAADTPAVSAAIAAFEKGKRLIEAGQDATAAFREALRAWEQAGNAESCSPARFRNLGNAAYLAGDLPLAILYYRLGLMQTPHDTGLRRGLNYCRRQVLYPPDGRGRPEALAWPPWLPSWSSAGMALLAAVGYLVTCLAGTWFWWRRRFTAVLFAVAGLAAAVAGYEGWRRLDAQRRRDAEVPVVVVRGEQVAMFTGNGRSYPRHPQLPTLQAGMEARRLATRGDWWLIEFADGTRGWIRGQEAYAGQIHAAAGCPGLTSPRRLGDRSQGE